MFSVNLKAGQLANAGGKAVKFLGWDVNESFASRTLKVRM